MKSFWLVLLVAGVVATPTYAHHSAAMFDMAKEVTLQGTVKGVEITNPHSWLQVVVPGEGAAAAEWSVEMANPGSLTRQGFKRSSLNVGDKIAVTLHPLRDGRPGGVLMSVKTAAGAVLPRAPAPTAY